VELHVQWQGWAAWKQFPREPRFMIFKLAEDFADALAAMPADHPKPRMLELLQEAVRRDIHFVARHPTTLFQCMWNLCWWYDRPETASHYVEPEGWLDGGQHPLAPPGCGEAVSTAGALARRPRKIDRPLSLASLASPAVGSSGYGAESRPTWT